MINNDGYFLTTIEAEASMFFIKYETEENINGEQPPIDDEAKKHNENLPGMGGVFNVVNLHLYHYAGIGQRSDSELQANNPVKYMDPTGRDIIHLLDPSAAGIFGHSAALIGNDQDGWLYYSNDGPKSTTVKWFNNLDEFSAGKKGVVF